MAGKPARRDVSLSDTHRLIPSKYSPAGTVLAELADEGDDELVHDLVALDAATNTRLKADEGLLPGISVHELVYGVSYANVVNAAFVHASPYGGRFNSNERGAWYAGVERETSMAEVAFHKLRELEEVSWPDEELATYDDYLADFRAEFVSLYGRHTREFEKYLQPGPIPACYARSQRLAAELIAQGANGIIYPSVRRRGAMCVVCFRPALVYHVRCSARFEFRLRAGRKFAATHVRQVKLRG
jgi:hypothetical protein